MRLKQEMRARSKRENHQDNYTKMTSLKVCIYMHKKDNKHKDDYIYSKESIFEKHNKIQQYKYLPELV